MQLCTIGQYATTTHRTQLAVLAIFIQFTMNTKISTECYHLQVTLSTSW